MDGPTAPAQLQAVINASRFEGNHVSAEPLDGGHIHHNLLVTCTGGRYVLQHLNDRVFPDIGSLVANVERLTAHLECSGRRCPRLVEADGGAVSLRAVDGSTWRAFAYLEGTVGRFTPAGLTDAFEAGRAFADYVGAPADLPGPPLATTIAPFHDLPRRLAALEAAVVEDPVGRRSGATRQIEWARRLGGQVAEALRDSHDVAVRVVHNDAKLSNLRFDVATGRAACVVDLDTTMAGRVRSDVGELVRTVTTHAPEDAGEEAVDYDLELPEALVEGYFSTPTRFTASEVGAMALSGPEMAAENAVRSLADHLVGDRSFAVDHPGQNLDRCRTQLRLTEKMLEAHAETQACFARTARRRRPSQTDLVGRTQEVV